MPANEVIPYYEVADRITARCSAAVTGKKFVKISGNRISGPGLSAAGDGGTYQVAQTVAGDKAFGVAMWDAAINTMVPVIREGIVPVTAGAAITAGQEVQSDANGAAIPLAAGKALGLACTGAANGADAEIALYK